jgi:LmbE family N-acetylglucosaminyl deacetylase
MTPGSPARRPLKHWLRGPVYSLVEAGWRGVFAVAGRLRPPAATHGPPRGGERVLLVAPHPDDETLGAGGTLALHARAGDPVLVLMVTDGGASRAGGLSGAAMRQARAAEARAAVAHLGGARLVLAGLPEGDWAPADLAAVLQPLLVEVRPTLIYAPSGVDFHPDHQRVAAGLAAALAAGLAPACRAVRVYEVQVPLTPLLVNCVVPTGSAAAAKGRALAAYATQQGSFAGPRRQAGYLRALYRAAGPVEVFWELAPAAYSRLMGSAAGGAAFRGLRERPWTDGWAWLGGTRTRRGLRRATRGPASGR